MPTTTRTEHQARWDAILDDPALRDLPYKVETNASGQIVLTPHRRRHSKQQKQIIELLETHLPQGTAYAEMPIATSEGVRQPDVTWESPERGQAMDETGDPPTLAPEICVEVMSSANSMEEMMDKRRLYREAGADEVWVVSEDGHVRFFRDDELDASARAPSVPRQLPDES